MRTAPPKSDEVKPNVPLHRMLNAEEKRDDTRLKRENANLKREDVRDNRNDLIKMKRDDVRLQGEDVKVKRNGASEKRDAMRVKRDEVTVKREDVKESRDDDGGGGGGGDGDDDDDEGGHIINKYHIHDNIQFDGMNQIWLHCDGTDALEKEQRTPFELQSAFSVLFEREKLYMPDTCRLEEGSELGIDPDSRKKAIRWLLKMRAFFNFSVHTAALSINYLDRFLSERQITNGKAWVMHLLAVACLSLAAKMEEIEVPSLLDLQDETHFFFEASTIQRMELLVLSTLEWRMRSITPISYTHILMPTLHPLKINTKTALSSRLNDLIFEAIQDPMFLRFRPSSIAGAAILCVLEEIDPTTFDDQKTLLLCILPLQSKVELMNCRALMMELYYVERVMIKDGVSECSAPRSPMGVLDASFSSSSSITSCINSQTTSEHVSSTISPNKWRIDNDPS